MSISHVFFMFQGAFFIVFNMLLHEEVILFVSFSASPLMLQLILMLLLLLYYCIHVCCYFLISNFPQEGMSEFNVKLWRT